MLLRSANLAGYSFLRMVELGIGNEIRRSGGAATLYER